MVRRSGGWVSCSTKTTPTSIAAHRAVTVQSIPRQPTGSARSPPTSGASTGAMPPTVIISVNALAAARPVATSAITARAMTMPPAPEKPWTSRATTSTGRLGATAHAMPAATQTVALAISGRRRPYRSEIGPITSWPKARPIKKVVSVSWTPLGPASSASPMAGKPGR